VLGVASLEAAGPDQVALLANAAYLPAAEASRAGAFLTTTSLAAQAPDDRPRVVVEDAHAALIPLLERFHPAPAPRPGVHPTAILGRGVRLGEAVTIGPYAVLEEGAAVGDRVQVGAHAVIGRGVTVGQDSMLHPHVVLYPGTVVGARVILHAGVRLGVDGFGYAWVDGGHRKVPQVGRCVVEDDVEIGANTTVDRGSLGDTQVAHGSKLDNLVHLAHNVRLGPHCAAAALVGIAGSTRVGAGVLFAGQAGIVGHVDIGDGARIGAAAKVWGDVPPGETYLGDPARPRREYLRSRARIERLGALVERVRALEHALQALGAAGPGGPSDEDGG
jgi:UDP-3-O-[3-hydroxymyristoyl] glucosamine N-acyltransferase